MVERLHLRSVHYCIRVLLSLLLVGCASPITREPRAAPQLLYESPGEVWAIDVSHRGGKDQIWVLEWVTPHTGDEPSYLRPAIPRLVRLDLATGRGEIASDFWEGWPDSDWRPGSITASSDGPCFACPAFSFRTSSFNEQELFVRGRGRDWIAVTQDRNRARWSLRWSPDGAALAYLSIGDLDSGGGATEVCALTVPRLPVVAQDVSLTPEGWTGAVFAWAADSRSIYQVCHTPDFGECQLLRTEWPSLARDVCAEGGMLAGLAVARESGDVFFGRAIPDAGGTVDEESEGWVWAFHRLTTEGTATATPVRATGNGTVVAASPYGTRLAIGMLGGPPHRPKWLGVAVYSVEDGAARRLSAFDDTSIDGFFWVFGGKGLILAEGGKKIWLQEFDPGVPEIRSFQVDDVPPQER